MLFFFYFFIEVNNLFLHIFDMTKMIMYKMQPFQSELISMAVDSYSTLEYIEKNKTKQKKSHQKNPIKQRKNKRKNNLI